MQISQHSIRESPFQRFKIFDFTQLLFNSTLLVCHRGLLSRYNSKWDRERRESFWDCLENFNFNFGNSLLIEFLDIQPSLLLVEKKETPPWHSRWSGQFIYEGPNSYGRNELNWLRITEMLRITRREYETPAENPTDRRRTLITKERYD